MKRRGETVAEFGQSCSLASFDGSMGYIPPGVERNIRASHALNRIHFLHRNLACRACKGAQRWTGLVKHHLGVNAGRPSDGKVAGQPRFLGSPKGTRYETNNATTQGVR